MHTRNTSSEAGPLDEEATLRTSLAQAARAAANPPSSTGLPSDRIHCMLTTSVAQLQRTAQSAMQGAHKRMIVIGLPHQQNHKQNHSENCRWRHAASA